MIYIWDNGGSYSDWSLEFIETDKPEEIAKALILSRGGEIVGRAERIEWWSGGAKPLGEFLDLWDFFDSYSETVTLPPGVSLSEVRALLGVYKEKRTWLSQECLDAFGRALEKAEQFKP